MLMANDRDADRGGINDRRVKRTGSGFGSVNGEEIGISDLGKKMVRWSDFVGPMVSDRWVSMGSDGSNGVDGGPNMGSGRPMGGSDGADVVDECDGGPMGPMHVRVGKKWG
uniref:Uncharacterized protein n=1 Tax=Cannabis sativa TaxID=3483 RepID=A0A803PH40_CANSA